MKVVSVEEMRAIETAGQAAGVTTAAMMEQAGEGIARAIVQRYAVKGRVVLILVGPGNNGGDGLVAGRHLAEAGGQVKCYLLKPRPEDDPNLAKVRDVGVFVADAESDQRWRVLRQLVAHADLIVDALVGTGARLPLAEPLASLLDQVRRGLQVGRGALPSSGEVLVEAVNAAPAPPRRPAIVAVDCPSGLDCDTGALDAAAIPADLTVTMGMPKRGMFRDAGVTACGTLVVTGIGLPQGLKAVDDLPLELVTADWVRARLPARPPDAHKDTFGRVMIVAGSLMYTGAAALAAEGAYRAGAGLVQLAVPLPLHAALAARVPEATFVLLPHDRGVLTADAAPVVRGELGRQKALLIGCGLGQEPPTAEFIDGFFTGDARAKRGGLGFLAIAGEEPGDKPEESQEPPLPPLVVDADGLNLLAKLDDWPKRLPAESVLTPHPGEMGRLLGIERDQVQADRLAVALRAAREWGHVVVLKGAYTVVAAPDGRAVIEPWASPALARAGTGDVLAGAIVALLGQGLKPFDAAACGAYAHGLAGHFAQLKRGSAGVLASDVARGMARAMACLYGDLEPAGGRDEEAAAPASSA